MKKSEYNAGDFLLCEGDGTVFLHDGTKDGDGYGAVIGMTTEGVVCRSSGDGNWQKGGVVRLADLDEVARLVNAIRHARSIPFYSCCNSSSSIYGEC